MNLLEKLDHIEADAADFGVDPSAARAAYDAIEREETIWINSRYQVNVRPIPERDGWPALIHLSIKRRDKMPLGDERYRDFQRIKDELLGPEYEAVELYPARSREIDTSTQYHLWALASDRVQFPFGFDEGRKVVPPVKNPRSSAFQNPFEPHHPR